MRGWERRWSSNNGAHPRNGAICLYLAVTASGKQKSRLRMDGRLLGSYAVVEEKSPLHSLIGSMDGECRIVYFSRSGSCLRLSTSCKEPLRGGFPNLRGPSSTGVFPLGADSCALSLAWSAQ